MKPEPLPPELAIDHPPFDLALLDQWDYEQPEDAEREPVRWQISGMNEAEWAMRQVAKAEVELAELEGLHRQWVIRVNEWAERQGHKAKLTRDFFAGHLQRYALACRAMNPRAKSLVLPSGRVQTRSADVSISVDDENALIAWARANLAPAEQERIVKVKETASRSGLKALVEIKEADEGLVVLYAGERVPGCHAEPGHVSATVQAEAP